MNRSYVTRLLASLASGMLLVLCFPRFDHSVLAWVALIPLTLVAFHSSPRASFGWGYLAGAVFFVASLYWLRYVTIAGWLALGLFLGLYVGAWGWILARFHAHWIQRRLPPGEPGSPPRLPKAGQNLLLAFLGATAWVALEIVRTHLFTGFPWNLLGVSQYTNLPVIQVATLTGVYGVSWLVCFVNLCIAETILRIRAEMRGSRVGRPAYRPHLELTVALALVMAAMIGGLRTIRPRPLPAANAPQVLSVAVVQPNIPQYQKWDDEFRAMIYERLESLTLAAARNQPDLLVWPETAVPDPLEYDATAFRIVTNAVRQSQGYLLAGSMSVQSRSGNRDDLARPDERLWFNSAYLVTPGATLEGPYSKMHLVPFGEFVPLEGTLPFLTKIVPIPGSIGRGRDHRLFAVRDSKVGVVICYEDVFPDLCRRFVDRGAQSLVNITNDGWYLASAGPYQHMANAVFRAIENRVPLVRAANTGYSCFIDSRGRVISRIAGSGAEDIFVQAFKTDRVVPRHPDAPRTFYTRYGDVFAWGCFVVALAALGLGYRRPRA